MFIIWKRNFLNNWSYVFSYRKLVKDINMWPSLVDDDLHVKKYIQLMIVSIKICIHGANTEWMAWLGNGTAETKRCNPKGDAPVAIVFSLSFPCHAHACTCATQLNSTRYLCEHTRTNNRNSVTVSIRIQLTSKARIKDLACVASSQLHLERPWNGHYPSRWIHELGTCWNQPIIQLWFY
jgi:hypothetical protein